MGVTYNPERIETDVFAIVEGFLPSTLRREVVVQAGCGGGVWRKMQGEIVRARSMGGGGRSAGQALAYGLAPYHEAELQPYNIRSEALSFGTRDERARDFRCSPGWYLPRRVGR